MEAVINVRLTKEQHRKLMVLGGSVWVREQIALGEGQTSPFRSGRPTLSRNSVAKVARFQARASQRETARFIRLGGTAWLCQRILHHYKYEE